MSKELDERIEKAARFQSRSGEVLRAGREFAPTKAGRTLVFTLTS